MLKSHLKVYVNTRTSDTRADHTCETVAVQINYCVAMRVACATLCSIERSILAECLIRSLCASEHEYMLTFGRAIVY